MEEYALVKACKEKPVGIKSVYVGEVVGQFDPKDKTISDRFVVTLEYKGKEMTVDYFMGIGNRVLPKYMSNENGLAKYAGKKVPYFGLTKGSIALLERLAKPVAPNVESVLYSLLMDSSALDMTFEEWCGDYGYEEDSIKANKIFAECNEQGKKLKRLLGEDYNYFMENNEY